MTTDLLIKVFISALGTVGLIEFLKNFLKTEKSWIYSLIMPFVAVGCYFACQFCNVGVIGSILTVGTVQLSYQTLVQGFKKVINANLSKIGGVSEEASENKQSDGAGAGFSEQ